VSLRWLLEHGAKPNTKKNTALDYLIGTYVRSPALGACIDLLRNAGGVTRYDLPGVMDTIQGRVDRLAEADVHHRFPELDCGSTGARRLLLQGATLLHVAAEFGQVEAAKLLIARGADVNARALVDEHGVGGQTPIFHAATQFDDHGLAMAQLLIDHGADLSVRAKLPGHYERPDEIVECTPLEYASLFPGDELPNQATVQLLRSRA
jgi:ankyrin repeat protein